MSCFFGRAARFLMLAAFCWLVFCGCGESSEETGFEKNRGEAISAAQAVDAEAGGGKDKFLKETEEALDALDERIRSLKEEMADRWSQMEPKARREAEEALEKMKKQRRALTQKLKKLRDSSAEAWEEMKKEFRESFDALKKSLEEQLSEPSVDTDTKYI